MRSGQRPGKVSEITHDKELQSLLEGTGGSPYRTAQTGPYGKPLTAIRVGRTGSDAERPFDLLAGIGWADLTWPVPARPRTEHMAGALALPGLRCDVVAMTMP